MTINRRKVLAVGALAPLATALPAIAAPLDTSPLALAKAAARKAADEASAKPALHWAKQFSDRDARGYAIDYLSPVLGTGESDDAHAINAHLFDRCRDWTVGEDRKPVFAGWVDRPSGTDDLLATLVIPVQGRVFRLDGPLLPHGAIRFTHERGAIRIELWRETLAGSDKYLTAAFEPEEAYRLFHFNPALMSNEWPDSGMTMTRVFSSGAVETVGVESSWVARSRVDRGV